MVKKLLILSSVLYFVLLANLNHVAFAGQNVHGNPPIALDASFSTPGRSMTIRLGGRGGQGRLKLEIVSPPSHGNVKVKDRPGKVKYRPKAGFSGNDSFTFRVVDERGAASEPATVTIAVAVHGDRKYSRGIQFDPPPYLKKIGATRNRLFKLGYLDVTWYDGWEGHSVDPTGKKDSTIALQKAIDDGYDYQLAVFIPAGTYTVSDTLRVIRKRARFATYHGNTLVGSRKGAQPIIRLAPNAQGFDNPNKPKPVVWVWTNREGDNRSFGTPASEFSTNSKHHWTTMGFMQSVSNLTIDCNGLKGNTGAIGLQFGAAQASDIHDVKVIATGAFAGFYNIPSRSSAGAANIEVEGGRYGLYLDRGASSVIVGAILRNQTQAALYCKQFVPIAMVGFHIIKESGPVITLSHGGYSRAVGTISLMDGIIELGKGGTALDNSAGKNLYARNVYVKGTNQIVKTPQGMIKASGKWKRIQEYAQVDQYLLKGDRPYEPEDSKFASVSVVNGKISKQGLTNLQSNSESPPANLVSRHVWKTLPSFEDTDAVVLTEVSAANGSDDKDDWVEFQKTVDSHRKIFVPKGLFRLGQTLTLKANTKLFGISRPLARIYSHPSWKPTSEVSIIQTVDDANATTYLGTLHLGFQWGNKKHDWFNLVNWRSGAKSMVMGVTDRYGAEARRKKGSSGTNPHSLWKVSGNGGGRWYFWGVDKSGPNEHVDYRHMLIDGTNQPLWFYGFNLEKGMGLAGCEIRDARNVRIFSVKVEKHRPIFKIHDSQNIAIFSSGAMRKSCRLDAQPAAYYWITGNSKNILFANINPQKRGHGEGSFTLLEDTAHGKTSVDYPEMVSVYKRGKLDDEAMYP
ncbi:MAG: hypothetical protein GY807_00180 [Gammaproteobacteria bacterium]|nr:hypothetical protein [Gammaproteobacteria bacterium]